MKDFVIQRHRMERISHDKPTLRQVVTFCAQAFCVSFTLIYILSLIYQHAR